jgi:hypothetical protein
VRCTLGERLAGLDDAAVPMTLRSNHPHRTDHPIWLTTAKLARSAGRSIGGPSPSSRTTGRLSVGAPFQVGAKFGNGRPSGIENLIFSAHAGGEETRPHMALCLADFHSITSSARAIKVAGIVIPSASAVLRLTTMRKWTGCWTGRSAGLAPLRIMST